MDEKESFQDSYDKETNHSINKEKQAEWLKKIEKMLVDLEEYSNYWSDPFILISTGCFMCGRTYLPLL